MAPLQQLRIETSFFFATKNRLYENCCNFAAKNYYARDLDTHQ